MKRETTDRLIGAFAEISWIFFCRDRVNSVRRIT